MNLLMKGAALAPPFSCTTKYSSDVYSPRPPDIRVRLLPTKPPVHFTTEQPGRDRAKKSSKIKKPAVIGAVIDLGRCLNLMDDSSSEWLKKGYQILEIRCEAAGIELPKNRPSQKGTDILLRDLDCAVIQQIHLYLQENHETGFDSVRGVFVEGGPPYPGAEFREKTHVQICIINPNCIKGYFNPLEPDKHYIIP